MARSLYGRWMRNLQLFLAARPDTSAQERRAA